MNNAPLIEVKLRYFAALKDQAKSSQEVWVTNQATAGDLYSELKNKHHFKLNLSEIRVAINGNFASIDQPIFDSDEIVFIPPVSGG
jgi:molybdopterin converting factor subunit 1